MISTVQAVEASVTCGRRLGLRCAEPQVMATGYSVRVWLAPHPVVTRVVTVGRILRGDPFPWMQREVEVARYLDQAGAPVVGPWDDPGPHIVDGIEVSLWHLAAQVAETVTMTMFGDMLSDLHESLASYPAELPLLVGPLTDIEAALATSNDLTLWRVATKLLPMVRSWPRRPLHGDSHPGNLLVTPTGPRWIDFEDTCVGPAEWDLASMSLTDEAVAAYRWPIDPELLGACRELRRLQVLAGVLTDDLHDATLYEDLVAALDRHR